MEDDPHLAWDEVGSRLCFSTASVCRLPSNSRVEYRDGAAHLLEQAFYSQHLVSECQLLVQQSCSSSPRSDAGTPAEKTYLGGYRNKLTGTSTHLLPKRTARVAKVGFRYAHSMQGKQPAENHSHKMFAGSVYHHASLQTEFPESPLTIASPTSFPTATADWLRMPWSPPPLSPLSSP